jgi:hypothetical protein
LPAPTGAGIDTSAITTPSAEPGSGGGLPGGGIGAGLPGGGGSGASGDAGVSGGGSINAPDVHAGSGQQLQDGVHVGADNAMSASSAGAAQATPVAGSAAPAQDQGGHQGGGVGGVPFGAGGRGAGGGQEQESARRYPQRGDVVGEDDLEEWQRMGPVIGEG